jgi:hypothetical protein
MALLGLRLVDERTGHTPGLMQVTLRTILTLPPLVGGAALINQPLMPPDSELPAVLVGLAVAAVGVGIICMAWALLDSGQMLHDRLTGLSIIKEHDARHSAA